MSQLNVDVIRNRTGTGGPTTPDLNVTGSLNVGNIVSQNGLTVIGIVTANSFNTPSGTGLSVAGVTTSLSFVSTVATGTAPLVVNSTTRVTNLNADYLDDQTSAFYRNADNLNAGIVSTTRLATSGTPAVDTFLRGDQTWSQIVTDYGTLEQVTGGTRKNISALYTMNARLNTLNSWSSTGPWTTLYGYGANGQTDAEQWAWFGLGLIPRASDTTYNFGDTGPNFPFTRHQMNVNGNSIGSQFTSTMYANGTSYNPVSILMMPIRNNHPTLSKTITIYGMHSTYWSSGYDGSSLWQYAPGQNATYSGVTSGTWTNLGQRSGTSSYGLTWSANMTIPAQTTYVAMQVATNYYWTGYGNVYWMFDQNRFYSLSSTFSDPYIQVDSRMINTMRFADWQRYGLTATNAYQFYKVYNACADMYGNR